MTAWIALGLSILALAWNVIELLIRWPRIGVVLRQHVFVDMAASSSYDMFDLLVVNNGAEAASIATVGICSKDRSRTADVKRIRNNGEQVDGPELPARVEAHGALRWVFGPDQLAEFPPRTEVVGYAHRYRTFRKYPKKQRNPIRLHKTVISSIKNN